ncbi:hypothetical protein [Nocardia pneumoniae]|uniref:hypothetical protein n=1 Tax=Nocardia pneumoniae TaxID=228601 RepID=UPI0012F69BB1|nr:hypothetical protein [Nocardia pneumoniae]
MLDGFATVNTHEQYQDCGTAHIDTGGIARSDLQDGEYLRLYAGSAPPTDRDPCHISFVLDMKTGEAC